MDRNCRLVALLILLWTTAGLAEETSLPVAVVENAALVMLRSEPRVSKQTAIGAVPRGTRLPLVGQSENWFQVELADGTEAWISRAYARVATLEQPFWIVAASVSLRSSPSGEAPTVTQVTGGELVPLLEREGDWARIELSDGSSGWIPASAIETALEGSFSEDAQASSPGIGEHNPAQAASAGQGSSVEPPETQAGGSSENQATDEPMASTRRETSPPAPSTAETASERNSENLPTIEESPGIPPVQRLSEPLASRYDVVFLIGGLVAMALVMVGGYWWYRRRRVREIEQLIRAGQGSMVGGEFLKNLREAEIRQARLEKDLQQRLEALRGTIGTGQSLEDSDESLAVGRIEEIRKLVLEQQAKVNALSDLLALQNQKLAAAEEENRLLRQLLPRR